MNKKITSKSITINIKEDKWLEKVEEYVEQERDHISTEISDKKHKRDPDELKHLNLDVMISRLSEESKSSSVSARSTTRKNIMYIVYILITLIVVILCIKTFS